LVTTRDNRSALTGSSEREAVQNSREESGGWLPIKNSDKGPDYGLGIVRPDDVLRQKFIGSMNCLGRECHREGRAPMSPSIGLT
jgi:hypothetical protein